MALHVDVICVGKTKQNFVLEGEQMYLQRLKSAWKMRVVELDSSRWAKLNPEQLRVKETQLAVQAVQGGSYLIALDEQGKSFNSKGLADFIKQRMDCGDSHLTFAIGGAYGWAPEMRTHARLMFSLSPLTFPFQIARLLLVEQLYRSHTLLNGMPYQK